MNGEKLCNHQSIKERIHFMDELRGFAIVLMVAYHGFYTMGYMFDVYVGRVLFLFFMPVEPFFAGMFIFICGISCRLSHSNLKRGFLLLLVSLVITLVMWVFIPQELILFGILHFLSIAILMFVLLRPLLDGIHPLAGLLICGFLLLITWWMPSDKGGVLGIKGLVSWQLPQSLNQPWLFPLGFGELESSDYFPIFPWIFCFLGGSFFGVWAAEKRLPLWLYRRRVPVLSKLGKHTLLIYILHQPVIYALCYLIFLLVGQVST